MNTGTNLKIGAGLPAKTIIYIVCILFTAACIIPLWLVVSISFSNEHEILKSGYSLIPRVFSIISYKAIFVNPVHILNSYFVTSLVTFSGTVLALFVNSTFAYAITRKKFKYRRGLMLFVMFTMIFSGGLVPYYILIMNLKLPDTIFVLFLPSAANAGFILMMKGYISTIPESILESAKMDGASEYRIYAQLILPLSRASLATVGLFCALGYWNDWYQAMLFINNEKLYPLQYLLYQLMSSLEFMRTNLNARRMGITNAELPTLSARMAMAVIAVGPMLLLFPFFQRYFIKGITMGSIKG